jgi:hypothetical protein
MTFREYVALLDSHRDGLAELATHPGEDPGEKLRNLQAGLARLRA